MGITPFSFRTLGMMLAGLAFSSSATAQDGEKKDKDYLVLHGSIQSDILMPEVDNKIGTGTYKDDILTNTYAELTLASKHFEVGGRFEFLEHPLPGFENEFKGWGVPHIYAKFTPCSELEVTLGDFYDQFGSGLIFRSYEERSLGIDNSIRGARIAATPFKGVRFKFLEGIQRRYWDWDTDSWVAGTDLEIDINQYSQKMRDNNVSWTIGGSYVFLNYEKNDQVVIPGTNYELNLPSNVNAFDVRSSLTVGNYNILAEYAWRTQDPSFDNGYIYRRGSAVLLSASYSSKGVSALVQAKRSENMSFRSNRYFWIHQQHACICLSAHLLTARPLSIRHTGGSRRMGIPGRVWL